MAKKGRRATKEERMQAVRLIESGRKIDDVTEIMGVGRPFEWDVQLSRTGRSQIGWLSPDGNMAHVNVSPLGEVTH
jgi:hypothetical protein